MITPAISVLSAVEGLEVATPRLEPFVVPMTIVILIGALLHPDAAAPASVGALFGRSWCVWFVAIGALGVVQHRARPVGARARSTRSTRSRFFAGTAGTASSCSGASSSCVTGGEALYADMGHFGARPIRIAWLVPRRSRRCCSTTSGRARSCCAIPRRPRTRSIVPRAGLGALPMVVLATVATVIASQALISGAFSLTHQAMQLGYCPRRDDRAHLGDGRSGRSTSRAINWALASRASSRSCSASRSLEPTSPPPTASR